MKSLAVSEPCGGQVACSKCRSRRRVRVSPVWCAQGVSRTQPALGGTCPSQRQGFTQGVPCTEGMLQRPQSPTEQDALGCPPTHPHTHQRWLQVRL